MRLREFIHALRETEGKSLTESSGYERWITTWTVPGQPIRAGEGQHHGDMLVDLISDRDKSEEHALEMGWVRGGFYQTTTNDHIYLAFDENHATKRDVQRTLQYLIRLFRKETGQRPDSVYTPSGEILLRDFPMVISHLREWVQVWQDHRDESPEFEPGRKFSLHDLYQSGWVRGHSVWQTQQKRNVLNLQGTQRGIRRALSELLQRYQADEVIVDAELLDQINPFQVTRRGAEMFARTGAVPKRERLGEARVGQVVPRPADLDYSPKLMEKRINLNESYSEWIKFWYRPDRGFVEWNPEDAQFDDYGSHHGFYALNHPDQFGLPPDMGGRTSMQLSDAAIARLIQQGWTRGDITDSADGSTNLSVQARGQSDLIRALPAMMIRYKQVDLIYYGIEQPVLNGSFTRGQLPGIIQRKELSEANPSRR